MFKEFAHLAAEEAAQQVNRRQIDPGGGLFVECCDRASIEAGLAYYIRNAELVSPHKGGEMATDHFMEIVVCAMQRSTMLYSAKPRSDSGEA